MLGSMGPVTVMHVDEHLIVTNKPAGLLAVPGRGEAGRDNLATRVQALYADALVVHRLDMATSGLLLFARGAAVQRQLSQAFAQRQVHKVYVAIVEGLLLADEGEINAPLAADWPDRPRQKVDLLAGKPSLTRWRVLERGCCGCGCGPDCTRVALHPISGRSHQLRVHMQHIGHPVRGDALYAAAPLHAPRLLLHAEQLAFAHPATGQAVQFHSACDF